MIRKRMERIRRTAVGVDEHELVDDARKNRRGDVRQSSDGGVPWHTGGWKKEMSNVSTGRRGTGDKPSRPQIVMAARRPPRSRAVLAERLAGEKPQMKAPLGTGQLS